MRKLLIATLACVASVGVAAAQTTPPAAPTRAAAMFSEADTDHNGGLSAAEFSAVRTAHFASMDANHDGSLAGAELPQGPPAAAGAAPAAPHHFSADANNDNALSSAEFNAQGTDVFAHLDADHDGSVTAAEMDAAAPPRH